MRIGWWSLVTVRTIRHHGRCKVAHVLIMRRNLMKLLIVVLNIWCVEITHILIMAGNLVKLSIAKLGSRAYRWHVRLLCFHPSILEPNLNLSLGQFQCVGDFDAPSTRQIAIAIKLFLQFERLLTSVCLAWAFLSTNNRWKEAKEWKY